MSATGMEIRFISFIGPKKKPAELNFGSGLNLIFGPSNTGKSSVLDALDFMLGREKKLKEIPQHEGYNQVLLGLEFSNEEKFTFIRNISGGEYECYEGLHKKKPDNQKGTILKTKNPTKEINTISDFILKKLGLNDLKLKKNIENKTVKLTLRNFLPIAIITETDIQKECSPYISNQHIEKTETRARLKLLLTGVDDKALLPAEIEQKRLSRSAKIDFLEELIVEQKCHLSDVVENETLEDLTAQIEKITSKIEEERTLLDSSEEKYNSITSDRRQLRIELEKNKVRAAEISEMLIRFELLKTQYQSDMLRLENIREAGSLIYELPFDRCPLCGSSSSDAKNHGECDGNISEIVSAASSEKQKILNLSQDLLTTMIQLKFEIKSVEDTIPKISEKISFLNNEISQLNPKITSQRNKYTELFSVKNNIEKSINIFTQLNSLQSKKEQLEKESLENVKSKKSDTGLSKNTLAELSQFVKNLLKKWNFPSSDEVHFDEQTEDFVISGKHRASNGKGYRAITHAAATLGLMKYAEEKSMPHLGFVVIDSPLLAYEKPENAADDLRGTDVNLQFLDSLASWTSRQSIVFENKKSIPNKYTSGDQIVHFTKGQTGRYGFFPINHL